MRGVYKFYQNGVLVGETHNLITTAGKRYILKYLAGYVGSIAAALSVGLGDTAANVADTSLGFEWSRVPIDLVSADYVNTGIIFKGKIPAEGVGTIYEVGLWSRFDSGQPYDSRLLLMFDSVTEGWTLDTGVSWETGTARLGVDALRLAPAAGLTSTSPLDSVAWDFSGYSNTDEFIWTHNVNTAYVASTKIRFATGVSDYFEYTSTTPTAGRKMVKFTKGACATTGTPSWSDITSVSVIVTSTGGGVGSIDMDGLRIEDRDFNSEEYILVSRAVPASPITKAAGSPMDFEYRLEITV